MVGWRFVDTFEATITEAQIIPSKYMAKYNIGNAIVYRLPKKIVGISHTAERL